MRIKATVAYDGSGYHGWQKQDNAHSIQTEIERALKVLHGTPTSVTASGRTDAGVHALGQVFHFDAPGNIPVKSYQNALNSLLPKDIRIQKTEAVPDDFHARFSARRKVYEYICTTDRNSPFAFRYKTILRRPVSLEAIRQAASFLMGEHDFTSFSCAQIDPRKSRIKRLDRLEITQEGSDLRFRFEGNGFLRYQVRMMMGALLAAGEGRIQPEDVKRMLEAKDKEACRFNAPAQGLYLVRVDYDEK